jgi:hypothetical protein
MQKVLALQGEIVAGDLTAARPADASHMSTVGVSPRFDTVRIRTGQITRLLAGIAVTLGAASTAIMVAGYIVGDGSKIVDKLAKALSLDLERNVPTFFSTLILLFASALLGVVVYIKRRENAKYVWHWAVLAVGFLYMAFDEMGEVHEKLIEPVRALLGGESLGVFYFAWVVPAILVVGFLGLVFLRFWWDLPKRFRLLFFIAGALYLSGAIGAELLNGKYAEIYGKENLAYQIMSGVEEMLEMAGVITLIYALLDYLAAQCPRIEVRLGRAGE